MTFLRETRRPGRPPAKRSWVCDPSKSAKVHGSRGSELRIPQKIVFSFSKDWYCGIEAQDSKYWNIYWVLIALRLTKSGIEYVILAGSSLSPLSWAKSRFLTGLVVVLARAARNFSRI